MSRRPTLKPISELFDAVRQAEQTENRVAAAEAHAAIAARSIEQGNILDAERGITAAIQLDPANPRYQVQYGDLFTARGMPAAAIFAYSNAISGSPDYAPAYSARAGVLAGHKLFDEALVDHRKAIELAPTNLATHLLMAGTLAAAGDLAGAEACCQKVLEINPQSPAAWRQLGQALQAHGKFAEAEAALAKSLALEPNVAVDALWLSLAKPEAQAEGVDRMNAIVSDPNATPMEAVQAGFALGDLLDRAGRFDDAFAAYSSANISFRSLSAKRGIRFDNAQLRQRVNAMVAAFTPKFFRERSGWGVPSEKPVYIVGMPRSGTSLIEQIAASHPSVLGAGERYDLSMIHSRLASARQGQPTDIPQEWTEATIGEEAASQLERLDRLALLSGKPDALRVIDKMPGNLMELGLMTLLFPQARIIFCQRDARDTCLSCFFHLFQLGQVTFSYDLGDCGRQSNEYERITEHWRSTLPSRMLFVQYEQLVANLEAESRRLIQFLDLPWDPACLRFHEADRPVLTRSAWQVRQPLFTGSIGRWKHYEKHLPPLNAALQRT